MNVLNEEQSMMVEAARRFVREQIIAPRLDMALDRSAEFPHAIIEAMWEQGLLNGEFPTEVGGAGLSCYDHTLVIEELNYGCLGIATSAIANSLAALRLQLADNEALRQKYLGGLVEKHGYAAYACSEPDAGSEQA